MWRLSPDMNSLVSTGVLAVYFSSLVALLKPSLGLTATFHEPVGAVDPSTPRVHVNNRHS